MPRGKVAVNYPAMNQHEKGERFRALHEGDPFVIPNPWDIGAARVLEGLGFPALATTSSGFAFTLGRRDGGATLDELVAHVGAMAAATDVPLAVDLEHGHGPTAADAARAIERIAEAGAVGGSIEDWDPDNGVLYDGRRRPSAWPRRPGPPAASASRSCSPAGPRTSCTATPTSTTPSRACRPTRTRAPTSSTPPASPRVDQIRAVCEAVGKPVNVLARPDLRPRRHLRRRRPAHQRGRRADLGGHVRGPRRGHAHPRRRRLLGPGGGAAPRVAGVATSRLPAEALPA